jgi:hypothetical protein
MMPDYLVTVYMRFSGYERSDMKSVSGAQRLTAVAVAISATFSIVWSMANLGYPLAASAAQAAAAVAARTACDGAQ